MTTEFHESSKLETALELTDVLLLPLGAFRMVKRLNKDGELLDSGSKVDKIANRTYIYSMATCMEILRGIGYAVVASEAYHHFVR